MKFIKTERIHPSWAAQKGQLLIPASNLDLVGFSDRGGHRWIFLSGECGLEAEIGQDSKKPDIGRVVDTYFNMPNEYSSSILLTDSNFILTNRICAIAITANRVLGQL